MISRFYGVVVSFLNRFQSPFLLAVRLYWGWQFFITGWGKFHDIPRVTGFFASLSIPFPLVNAYFIGGLETVGGLLLLSGLFSRPIAFLLTCNMTVAYLTAHRESVLNIFKDSDNFVTQPPFLFLLTSLMVLFFGPGKFSVDALICHCKSRLPSSTQVR